MREVMDCISDRKVERVVFQGSSQIAKTEVLLNIMGYLMHLDPCPMLFIEPGLDMAAAISKDRVAPMLRATPVLQGLVGKARSRDAQNAVFHKAFPGGHVTFIGAESPAGLASRPIRVVLADEVDRWPASAGAEGDPLSLAIKRTTTFARRKIIITSTPTIKGASRIEDWYSISDQRKWWTPCPRCKKRFVLAWEHVRFEDRVPESAHIECPACKGRIEDDERAAMVAAGEWRAEASFAGIAGFHAWEAFAPWRRLSEIVSDFLKARMSIETRQTWTNTCLGRTWETPGESVEPSYLMLRREDYEGEMPAGVKVLTAGIDTQDDRLEVQVLGWGDGEEAWVIDRVSIPGDPAREEVWKELDELLGFDFPQAGQKPQRIQLALVDAAGHRTQGVYRAVIQRGQRRLIAAFGRDGGESGLLVSPPKAIRPRDGAGNVLRRIVDVSQAKALVFSRLRVAEPGREYVHFPSTVDETYFDELTAEKLETRRNKYGVPTKAWVQTRERNESLDTFVLALAALRILAPTAARFDKLASDLSRR